MTEDAAIACHLTAFICRHLICPSCQSRQRHSGTRLLARARNPFSLNLCCTIDSGLARYSSRPGMTGFRLRQKSKFPNQINAESTVQSIAQKYFSYSVGQISFRTPPRPVPDERGAWPIVTSVGRGMRWTLVARQTNARTSGRRSRVVLTPRRWRQVGGDDPPAMVARKPGHQGEREGNRKTIARGMPVLRLDLW